MPIMLISGVLKNLPCRPKMRVRYDGISILLLKHSEKAFVVTLSTKIVWKDKYEMKDWSKKCVTCLEWITWQV